MAEQLELQGFQIQRSAWSSQISQLILQLSTRCQRYSTAWCISGECRAAVCWAVSWNDGSSSSNNAAALRGTRGHLPPLPVAGHGRGIHHVSTHGASTGEILVAPRPSGGWFLSRAGCRKAVRHVKLNARVGLTWLENHHQTQEWSCRKASV